MTKRIFLESIARPYSIHSLGGGKAWEVCDLAKDPGIPPLIYVVESDVGQRLLLGREICGRPKFNLLRYLAKLFVELFFEQIKQKKLSQYLIFRGAYPLDLQYAMGFAPPYDLSLLPTSFIKLQRILNWEGTDWEIHGENLVGEYQGDTWLIPDAAIASGSTIAFFLRNGFAHHVPKQVYVLTPCGSLEGIQRIYKECQKAGVELIPVFSECIFEVSKSGTLPGLPLTDLSILSTGSITTERFYHKALHRYQGTRMCCVGDVSDSLEDPYQYTIHTLREMQILGMDPKREHWDKWTVDPREKRFQKRVMDSDPGLYDYFKEVWKDDR